MFKKLACMASVLAIAGTASVTAENLTPLQLRVRDTFNKMGITVAEPVNVVASKEIKTSSENSPVVVKALAAHDSDCCNVITACDQDNECAVCPDEDDEFVVICAPESKTIIVNSAEDLSDCQRTAKINKKWSITALGWKSELTGYVKIAEDKNDTTAEKIDIEKDIKGLDKETVPGVKLSYKASGKSTVEVNWTKVDYDGVLGVSRTFKGKTYTANANVELNNSMYDLLWKYQLWNKKNSCDRAYLSGILGVKASDMEFSVSNAALGHTSYSEIIPVPYIGLEFGTNIGNDWYFKTNARYLQIDDIKDYDAKHCDFDVSLSYKVSGKSLFIDAGYRQVLYNVEGEGNDVELKYKGPYVGLEYLF